MSLFVTVAGLVAVGCGGGDDDASTPTVTFASTSTEPSTTSSGPTGSEAVPESTTTVTAPPSSISPTTKPSVWPPPQELLDEALLQIADMPTGWASIPDDGEDSDPPCGVSISSIVGVDEIPSGRAEYAEDANFGPGVILSVGVLPPDLGNLDVLGTLKQGRLDCQSSSDGFDLTFTELSYPPLGDQSYAFRLTVTDGDTTFTSDAVEARVGDVVIQLAGVDVFGDATVIIDQFAERQLARAVEVLG